MTKNLFDTLTTKTNKNNTYNISKDSNNTNSDSEYDRVSKNFKREENSYSEEEISNFSEHNIERGTLSSATENNLIEGKHYLPHPVLHIEDKHINYLKP